MTSRELMYRTLEFRNRDERAPRQMWCLPWAEWHYPEEFRRIHEDFPEDISGPHTVYSRPGITQGEPYRIGTYIDEWGCVFENIQEGVIGEVKKPLVPEEDTEWSDVSAIHIPEEWLSFDAGMVNESCKQSDKFLIGGPCPRPFEQLQFIRGTEQLFMDFVDVPDGLRKFLKRMHEFYCAVLEAWAKTDVDALNFMDDWGSQRDLLINPELWRALFKPLYKDYIDIAHAHGKKAFMHSDGNTLRILPDLIEIGLDAFNTQIFCIGVEKLRPFRGQICFWGEMDRQYIMPRGTEAEVRAAVQLVKDTLWMDGGCIAQCEFGVGTKPENVRHLFNAWNDITAGGKCE